MHAMKCRTKFVAFHRKIGQKLHLLQLFYFKNFFRLPCCWWAWQLIVYVTCKVRHERGLIKNRSMKSDFSQTRPSRSGFILNTKRFARSWFWMKLSRSDSSDWSDMWLWMHSLKSSDLFTLAYCVIIARCYAERGIAMASRLSSVVCLSVCDVDILWSYNVGFENNHRYS